MNKKMIRRQLGTLHEDEILNGRDAGHSYVFAFKGNLGYGNSAWEAVNDSGVNLGTIVSQSDYFDCEEFPFVSQCYDSEGEESGLFFRF